MPEKSLEQKQFLTLDEIAAELDIIPEDCTIYYSKSKN